MDIREFSKDIIYVGVNDRVTTLFEGLWPLPDGVSYNSYLVKGSESVALIDAVRIDEVREFLDFVRRAAAGRRIGYLVINHMEPDHSGSIPEVLDAFPEIRIVGNAQTIGMVRDFYHITDPDRFLEVKQGTVLPLGPERSLTFLMTPMVHWPETMMTYVEDAAVLFSGDAFGTFGALNGAVVDDEMDTRPYIEEMYRYYSNIVGKYGRFVMQAIAKTEYLKIEYICPTHGPVWHRDIRQVGEIVRQLASYKSQPGVTIVYGSMYGNTAQIAEAIAADLNALGVRNIHIHNAATATMSRMISDAFRYEALIVGSATYSMGLFPPVETFLNAMATREIRNKVFAAFGGYTWAKNVVLDALTAFAQSRKLDMTASLIMNRSMNSETRAAVGDFAALVARALKK